LICVRSHIGYGSPNKQDTFEAHGSPLGATEVRLAKERLGWPHAEPFTVPDEARAVFRRAAAQGAERRQAWSERFARWTAAEPELAKSWAVAFGDGLPEGWDGDLPWFSPNEKIATRAAAGRALSAISARVPTLIGGSADLNPSTNTAVKGAGDFLTPFTPAEGAQGLSGGPIGYGGRNIHYGVREHAMGSISNGIAAHGGVRPYTATFLQFSDYLRPAIRLAALSQLAVIHVFTHDSIFLGEDGPTHQPVEHLPSLRAIPNTLVLRPADANEAVEAWRIAMRHQHGPVALILTRQALPVFDRAVVAPASGVARGAYTLLEAEGGKPEVLLIATGSEVSACIDARARLAAEGICARVVSMPSWELFEAQEASYRDDVLPPDVRRRVVVEAASPLGWERFAGDQGTILAVRQFGASAPMADIAKYYGFTPERVAAAARALVRGTAD
jgi:transketolase